MTITINSTTFQSLTKVGVRSIKETGRFTSIKTTTYPIDTDARDYVSDTNEPLNKRGTVLYDKVDDFLDDSRLNRYVGTRYGSPIAKFMYQDGSEIDISWSKKPSADKMIIVKAYDGKEKDLVDFLKNAGLSFDN
jgi:hypothetical protein